MPLSNWVLSKVGRLGDYGIYFGLKKQQMLVEDPMTSYRDLEPTQAKPTQMNNAHQLGPPIFVKNL